MQRCEDILRFAVLILDGILFIILFIMLYSLYHVISASINTKWYLGNKGDKGLQGELLIHS